MNSSDVVADRAVDAHANYGTAGKVGPIRYHWGRGGFDPGSPTPDDERGGCDCSGFVAWCLGVSRHSPGLLRDGDWVCTRSLWMEAGLAGGKFETSHSLTPAYQEPGTIAVWPPGAGRAGHCGVLIGNYSAPEVIHCTRRGGGIVRESLIHSPFWNRSNTRYILPTERKRPVKDEESHSEAVDVLVEALEHIASGKGVIESQGVAIDALERYSVLREGVE